MARGEQASPAAGTTAGTAAVAAAAGSGLVLLTLSSAQFLMTLDSSVMNVSIATVASDVGTPITFRPARTFSPSSSTKCLAVEPVPRPSFMPSRTSSRARAAACRFKSSIDIVALSIPPREAATGRVISSLDWRRGTGWGRPFRRFPGPALAPCPSPR